MDAFGFLKEGQKKSDIFFHTDVTLVDDTVLQGGEWLSVPWYLDTPTTGPVMVHQNLLFTLPKTLSH